MSPTRNEQLPEFHHGEILITTEHFRVSCYLRPDCDELGGDLIELVEAEGESELEFVQGFLGCEWQSQSKDEFVREQSEKICVTGRTESAKRVLKAVLEKRIMTPGTDLFGDLEEWDGKDPDALYLPYNSANYASLNAGVQVSTRAKLAQEYPELSRDELDRRAQNSIHFDPRQPIPSLLELEHLLSMEEEFASTTIDGVLDSLRRQFNNVIVE